MWAVPISFWSPQGQLVDCQPQNEVHIVNTVHDRLPAEVDAKALLESGYTQQNLHDSGFNEEQIRAGADAVGQDYQPKKIKIQKAAKFSDQYAKQTEDLSFLAFTDQDEEVRRL